MAKEKTVKPNVRLAAGADALGAGPVTVGTRTIATLPDEETQRRGFYDANAAALVALYQGRFLMIVPKGDKK